MNHSSIIAIIILLILSTNLFTQGSYLDDEGNKHLLGSISLEQLESEDFKDWYVKGVQEYTSNFDANVAANLSDVNVKIFMATWCGDTKRLLPEFIKTWTDAGLKESQLEVIALHREGKEYKRSPNRVEQDYDIHRVPTFVFERKGVEVGRIVERPINDLNTDLAQIALGYASKPRYQAVSILSNYFASQPIDSLYADFQPVLNKMYRNVSGPSELNTYGYVLMAAERYQEAEMAFKSNCRIFRYNPNLQDSLGELYVELEKYPEAKECFENVIKLKGSDERANEMLVMINEKLEN